MGLKVSSHTVGSHGNQPPFFGAFQKLTLLVEQDNPVTLEIPRFLGASNKDGYQILVIINYTIMSCFEIFFQVSNDILKYILYIFTCNSSLKQRNLIFCLICAALT